VGTFINFVLLKCVPSCLVDLFRKYVLTSVVDLSRKCVPSGLVDLFRKYVLTSVVDLFRKCVPSGLVDLFRKYVSSCLVDLFRNYVLTSLVDLFRKYVPACFVDLFRKYVPSCAVARAVVGFFFVSCRLIIVPNSLFSLIIPLDPILFELLICVKVNHKFKSSLT
jgi:hypothetical protein